MERKRIRHVITCRSPRSNIEMACERDTVLDKEGFDQILSLCVRKYPILYDKRDPSFRDKIKKNSAWDSVAEELKVEGGGKKYFSTCVMRYRFEKVDWELA